MRKNGPASRVASARSPSTQTDASSGGKYSDREDISAQTDASSGGKYSDREDISAQTDASSGGKYSDRRGNKCLDRCLKWR